MQIVDWKSDNFCCAMVEDDDRCLWTTTNGVALACGVTGTAITQIYNRRKSQFELRQTNCLSKDAVIQFLQTHMEHFGVKRFRDDMHIWSEDDVLTLAVLCKSPQAMAAKKDFIRFIKSNMRREYATLQAMYDELMKRMIAVEAAIPAIQSSASAAGAALQAHKYITGIRGMN